MNEYETMPSRPGATLTEARQWLRARQDVGAKCPCCKQLVKVYHRKLNTGMARSLIAMYRAPKDDPDGWVHVPTALDARSREEGKLRYWGLVEESAEERYDGGRAGWWQLTPTGLEFVLGRCSVRERAVVYDGRCLRLEGDPITIFGALGKRFNYNELMGFAL